MNWIIFDAYGTILNAGKENIPSLSAEIETRYNITRGTIFNIWSTQYFKLESNFHNNFMTIMDANRLSLSYTFGKLGLPIMDVDFYINKLIKLWSTPTLFAGVIDLIKTIKEFYPDSKLGIISNTDNNTLLAAIQYTNLPIKDIVSSETARAYKPDSRIFQYALAKWHATPENCIYIGNSIHDITSAKGANVNCIFINHENLCIPIEYIDVPSYKSIGDLHKDLKNKGTFPF